MIFKFLTSFGSHTLHNTTTHQGRAVGSAPPVATVNALTLPDGTLYDPYGSSDAPKTPQKITYQLLLVYGSDALCSAEFDALAALIGTKDTLTAQKPSGSSVTCDARLVQISDVSPPTYPLSKRRLTLVFQPYELFG